MVNLAIIGVGQIGSRHLQSLAFLKYPSNIFLVDPSEKSLLTSRKNFLEVYRPDKSPHKNIFFCRSIQDINTPIDIAIIATSSDCRADVIKNLLTFQKVKKMILEKILFQKIDDYFEMKNLFVKNKIQVWVNCYMRAVNFFHRIKKELDQHQNISMTVDGSRWSMATTSIHFIDLFAYLTGSRQFSITEEKLTEPIIDSKRKGFKEFFGEMAGQNSKRDTLRLICDSNGHAPNRICIVNGDRCKEIIFGPREITYSYGKGQLSVHQKIEIPLQSQLTHHIVHQIIDRGVCALSSSQESMELHLPFIKIVLNFFGNKLNRKIKICPIT